MNIKFVVLSCDDYLDKRVSSLVDTFLSNQKYVILIDSDMDIINTIGYNTPKNYDGIQDKYKSFFLNYDFSEDDYYFFIDDDTFVNLNNLSKLNLPHHSKKFCICRMCLLDPSGFDLIGQYTGYPLYKITGIGSELPIYHPSGGSGFILSKSSCLSIQENIKKLKYEQIARSDHGDVSIGFWMRYSNVEIINNNNFWHNTVENLYNDKSITEYDEKNAITFHYVNSEKMYEYNNKYNVL